MHKLLQRQLKRYLGEAVEVPHAWRPLLEAIDQAYHQADEDRRMLEHSFELASAEMIEMNVKLQKQLEERKKITEAMLRSEKMSAVGQLASGVAHEINNPLGVILGFAQAVLRRMPAQDPLELPLRSIEREALRCKNLAQDLLLFSRASKAEKEPLLLNAAVEGALSLVLAKAKTSQMEVKTHLGQNLPRLLGNTNQIQQIIINLATNALDAMGGKGTVTIVTERLDEGPLSWVCLRVTDTGPGIPAEVLPQIFEPFFTTKPAGQGTGLGLALINEIVAKHSGSIEVHSQPGQTEFLIKFPASPEAGHSQTPIAQERTIAHGTEKAAA